MVIVTGTKRSGTSMWMAALSAGGFEPIGKAFPGRWGDTIREANAGGFFESLLRLGIHHGTNPNPKTGSYIHHELTRRRAVKIFAQGLIRTHRAFIDHIVMTVRPWREYASSVTRLYAMEHAAAETRLKTNVTPPRMPRPDLEWWVDNFVLLKDLRLRGLSHRIVTYDNVLSNPQKFVGDVVDTFGGDGAAAASVVQKERRTQNAAGSKSDLNATSPAFEKSITDIFDDLYALLDAGQRPSETLWNEMSKMHRDLWPAFLAEVRASQLDRQRFAKEVRGILGSRKP